MSKYLFLFRGVNTDATSPDQIQAYMMRWTQWMQELTKKGKMVAGEPLDPPGKVLHGKARKITDGPFAEGKELIGGYIIVEASGMDEAVELSKECPIFEHDGSVEVRPVREFNM